PLDNDVRPVLANLKIGSLVIHHALTLHYAYSNLTPTERMAYAIIYMGNGVTFNGKRHPLTNGKALEKGKAFSGDDFPI
ncbi:hypothetical protein OSK10_28075, partial [Escherichia coli]|nr:hypothetical protein [Escherichia coli]